MLPVGVFEQAEAEEEAGEGVFLGESEVGLDHDYDEFFSGEEDTFGNFLLYGLILGWKFLIRVYRGQVFELD